MNRRTFLKNMITFMPSLAISGCTHLEKDQKEIWEEIIKDPRIPVECFSRSPILINGDVNLVVPREYQQSVLDHISFIQDLSRLHPNTRNLTDVVFYDATMPECTDENMVFLRAIGGASNGINYIVINDYIFYMDFFGGIQRADYFGHLLSGPKHILSHEFGHILFGGRVHYDSPYETSFAQLTDEELRILSPDNHYYGQDDRHYLIDRFGYFIEMAYCLERFTDLEENPLFVSNYIPALLEHPEMVPEARRRVQEWNLVPLYDGAEVHNQQLDFFVSNGAIHPNYVENLRYRNINETLTGLLELQKANAFAELDSF